MSVILLKVLSVSGSSTSQKGLNQLIQVTEELVNSPLALIRKVLHCREKELSKRLLVDSQKGRPDLILRLCLWNVEHDDKKENKSSTFAKFW